MSQRFLVKNGKFGKNDRKRQCNNICLELRSFKILVWKSCRKKGFLKNFNTITSILNQRLKTFWDRRQRYFYGGFYGA